MFNIKVCCITLYREEAWGGRSLTWGEAVSLGGDASPRRHLLDKARCLGKQIQNASHSYHCIAKLGHRAPT